MKNTEAQNIEEDISRDRLAIEEIIAQAEKAGRTSLTTVENARCEALFARLEQNKRRLEDVRKENEVHVNANLPAGHFHGREQVISLDSATRVDMRTGTTTRVTAREAQPNNEWLRTADGTRATVGRGESFGSHPVVKREMDRFAERDRHIVEAHGDFGQWLRAMDTSTQSAIVPTIWSNQIIDLARNQTVVMQAGATTVPMGGKVEQVGRLTTDAVAYWKGEGSPITPSDLAFDYVQFTAKSMGALCVASIEFMQDANNAGELIQASIAKAMAAKLDIQAFYGGLSAADDAGYHLDSADEPNAGIITELTAHAAGNLLGAAAADGTAITAATPFNELLDLIYTPRIANEASNTLVSNVAMQKAYDKLYTTTQEHAELPATVKNMQWLQTNAIPTFARGAKDHVSDLFAGDFSQVMIGMRLGVQLRFLTERYAENGQVGILAYFRGDIQIPRPAALAVYRYIQVEAN